MHIMSQRQRQAKMPPKRGESAKPFLPKNQPNLPAFIDRKCGNLYSEADLLHCLADYICDCVVEVGYKECMTHSNVRLGVNAGACLVALFGAVVPKFPERKWIILICAVTFFAMLFGLMVYEHLVVKSAIIALKDKSGRHLFLDLKFDRKNADVSLSLRQGMQTLTARRSVGDFFDEDGHLCTGNIYSELRSLLMDHETGATDEIRRMEKKQE